VPNFGLTATQFFIYSQTLDIIFTINISMRSSIVDNIRQGQLNLDLIRPLNIIWVQFWNNFGTRRILVQIMKIIFMIIYISINSTINPLIYFIVLIFISLFSLAITTGFFYLVRAYDLKKLEAGTFLHRISNENNLENYIITYPIYLLPKFILVYGTFFGFYYVANVTLGLIYGQSITYIILLLLTELILAIILIFFANLAWKKMLKYYEGFGG
jgi:ABC-type uncharacterized transport system permease subunit